MVPGLRRVAESWRKNWPELWCTLNGGMPSFVFASDPGPLGEAVPVFHYHVVDAPTFEADLAFLQRNGYRTATADELVDHLEGRGRLGPKHVVLSFDDGPVNLFDTAFPLLRRYEACGVAFIAPGLHQEEPRGGRRLCTWEEIRQMHESGCMDFQSHTHEHRFVPKWPQPQPLLGVDEALIEPHRRNPRPLEDDLQLAKRTIEGELGKVVAHLAFPNYRGTGEAIATAWRLGYRGIWHGTLAHRKCNEPGDRADYIVRLSGEFLRRLPGRGRCDLGSILRRRYGASFRRMVGRDASTSTAHRPCAEAKVSS